MNRYPTFSIVIAYENSSVATHAKESAEQLIAELSFVCDAWQFELLAVERARKAASMIASEADMVIVAASGERTLPEGVKDWIEGWLELRKAGGGILVALLGQGIWNSRKDSSAHTYLRWIAGRANMDFLCNVPQCSAIEFGEARRDVQVQPPLPIHPSAPKVAIQDERQILSTL